MTHEHWHKLKDGKKVQLRSISLSDVVERHEFFVKLSLAQEGIVHTIDEVEVHPRESHDQIYDFLKNHRGLWLVAKNPQKKIVGEIDLTIKNLARIRHNAFLTMGVLPEYQGQGLGSLLLSEASRWALVQGLLRIELSVFSHNHRARALYEKFGFMVEGQRKNFLRTDEGFDDDIIMAKYLSNEEVIVKAFIGA